VKIFRAFWQAVFISGYQVVDDVTRDIGQAVVMAGLAVGELFMVQPHQWAMATASFGD